MLPKIKKKITSFLLSEEGKIPKHSLLSLGSFVSAAVIGENPKLFGFDMDNPLAFVES